MLVMGSTSLRMKYFSVESLADMERCALVCTEINPGYSIIFILLLRTWNCTGTFLVNCKENQRSGTVVDIERAVQLTGSLRSLLGEQIAFRKGSSTLLIFLSHETEIPTKMMARSISG